MNKKIVWLIVSCLMVAALVLASCAPEVVEEKEATVVTTEPEKKAEEVEGVVEKVGPQYGGVLNLVNAMPLMTFSPLVWDGGYSTTTHGFVYECLLISDWWKDPERKDCTYNFVSTYQVRPDLWTGCLAESWEQTDPVTITFKIRKGVRWQNKPPVNGREFIAEDVKWSFEHMATFPQWSTLACVQKLESIECPDKYTVVFHFKEPDITLMRAIGFRPRATSLPREVWEERGDFKDWEYMVGTGPFIIEDNIPDSCVTFKRNPDYFQKDPDGNQLPYVDGVKIMYIPDGTTRVAALRTGKIDLTSYSSMVPFEQKPSLEATSPVNFLPVGGNNWHLTLKCDVPPFSDLKVRKAVFMATNRKEINDALFGGIGIWYAHPSDPAQAATFTPLEELTGDTRMCIEWSPEGVERAKELLVEAGLPSGFTVSAQYQATGKWEIMNDAVQLVKAQWAEIGVNLELIPIDTAARSALQASLSYDNILGRGTGRGDLVAIAKTHFYSGAHDNIQCDSNPDIDKLIDEASLEFDYAKRTEITKKLYRLITEQCYSVAMPQTFLYNAWQPWIKGYKGEIGLFYRDYGAISARVWLDQDLKKEMTGK